MKNSVYSIEELSKIIPLEGRIEPLKEEEKGLLSVRQTRHANGIINDNRRKVFAREYVRTGSVVKATNAIGVSSRRGYQLLSDKTVQGYIQEISDLAGTEEIINIRESMMQLSGIIRGETMDYAMTKDGEVVELPAQVKDRVRALDILTKCQGLQVSNHNVNARVENINVAVDVEQSEVIHEVNPEDVVIIDLD